MQPTMSHASDGEDVEAQLQDPSSKVSDMCCIYVSHGGASDGLHKLLWVESDHCFTVCASANMPKSQTFHVTLVLTQCTEYL